MKFSNNNNAMIAIHLTVGTIEKILAANIVYS